MINKVYTECKACSKPLTGRQSMYCSNNCKLSDPYNINLRTKPKEKQDKSKLIRCIVDGKIFKDIKNYSGVLTRHIVKLNISSDDVFKYFEIIDNPEFGKPLYNCKYCEWTTKDVANKSGCITVHLKDVHDILPSQHIQKYPEENNFWTYKHSLDLREQILSLDENSYIVCQECDIKFKRITPKHLKLHGISMDEYRVKYNVDVLSSNYFVSSSRCNYEEIRDKINIKCKSSKAETEIKEYLESLNVVVEISNRSILYPLEVDIYLPDYKIAIEYNGLYYHSEFFGGKGRDYHINKTRNCEEKGIRLIQIFEDEWISKKSIVQSRLMHILNKAPNRHQARKCIVKELDSGWKNRFLNEHHIQGTDKSKINLGLFTQNDILLSVMTFSGLRRALGHTKRDDSYELSRYATSGNIIGGASKMLSYFIKIYKPKQIISYADKRWTSGIQPTLYDRLGFTKNGETKPNYWYTKSYHTRLHRYTFTKQRIIDEFNGNPTLTEVQNMIEMGFDRVWDCGSFRYVMNLQ